jgi:hypothetical protein
MRLLNSSACSIASSRAWWVCRRFERSSRTTDAEADLIAWRKAADDGAVLRGVEGEGHVRRRQRFSHARNSRR